MLLWLLLLSTLTVCNNVDHCERSECVVQHVLANVGRKRILSVATSKVVGRIHVVVVERTTECANAATNRSNTKLNRFDIS
jgi:hypothetical protein